MFGRQKRKKDEVIGPSTGFVKWLTRFFRFVLYPFIHPVWFVTGLTIAAVAIVGWPAYNGVSVSEMPRWYKQKLGQYYHKGKQEVKDILPQKPLVPEVSGMAGRGINVMAVDRKPGKAELVTYETPQMVNRKAFQQAQDVPVDVAKTLQAQNNEGMPFFKRREGLGLTYLELPKKVTGRVKVINANEVKIGDEIFFLYGIYAAPSSKEGIAALAYLQQNIDGRVIDCFVGAYTADGMPTVICIYSDININQRLVDLKYSKDVSLN